MTESATARLAAIWRRIVQTDTVNDSSNFFLDGGDSRGLIALAVEIRDQLGVELPLGDIFEAQTFGGLRLAVESQLARRPA